MDFELIIAGGGLVGGSLAIALADTGLKVGLVEAIAPDSGAQPSYDDRSIALSEGSRRIFEGLGLWSQIQTHATPIRLIHVSDRGHFGFSRLHAGDLGVKALGQVVVARELGRAINARLEQCPGLTRICPARVTDVQIAGEGVAVTVLRDGESGLLHTRLVVAADGGNSAVRDSLGIVAHATAYEQSALVANISTERDHANVAYERFTEQGPMALLPLDQGRSALVWTQSPGQAERRLAQAEPAFLADLQDRFGWRLGRFTKVGERAVYPLSRIAVAETVRPRAVVIGNAAHTLHPIAGQGFNLGLRDAAVLAEVLQDAARRDGDVGSWPVLERYADWRQGDQRGTGGFTDHLVHLFSNDNPLLIKGRNLGLLALDLLPPAKRLFGRHAMGLAGRQPRLARGL